MGNLWYNKDVTVVQPARRDIWAERKKMKENLIGLAVCLLVILLGAGLTWVVQHTPLKFLLGQWPGILIGLAIGFLSMIIGAFLKGNKHDE